MELSIHVGGPRPAVRDQRFYGRTPHSGQDVRKEIRYLAKLNPHGELPPLQHPWPTLDVISDTWSGSVAALERRDHWQASELAREFHRYLQAQPSLLGVGIRSEWIRVYYPLFCSWLRVNRPPPYKDFARELALIMPAKGKIFGRTASVWVRSLFTSWRHWRDRRSDRTAKSSRHWSVKVYGADPANI